MIEIKIDSEISTSSPPILEAAAAILFATRARTTET